LKAYQSQDGVTPEYIEPTPGWRGAALNARELRTRHRRNAKTNERHGRLSNSSGVRLDAEPHLPLALGRSLEVQSQTLAARGQRAQATAVLQNALRSYGNTSIRARLQKNLNLLSFRGQGGARAFTPTSFLDRNRPCLRSLKVRPCCFFSGRTGVWTAKPKPPSLRNCALNCAERIDRRGPTRLYGVYGTSGKCCAQAMNWPTSTLFATASTLDCSTCRFPSASTTSTCNGASTTPTLVLP